MQYFVVQGDNVSILISSCRKMFLLPNKFCIKLQYFSGTHKIQENIHDFVLLTVNINVEVKISLKSKLFILYSRYNL